MVTRIEPLLTVADLDACPDDNNRYELIEGELFVSRAPGIPHQRVLHNLQMELGSYLKENPMGIHKEFSFDEFVTVIVIRAGVEVCDRQEGLNSSYHL